MREVSTVECAGRPGRFARAAGEDVVRFVAGQTSDYGEVARGGVLTSTSGGGGGAGAGEGASEVERAGVRERPCSCTGQRQREIWKQQFVFAQATQSGACNAQGFPWRAARHGCARDEVQRRHRTTVAWEEGCALRINLFVESGGRLMYKAALAQFAGAGKSDSAPAVGVL